jgi:hypothetical protein
MRRRIVPTGKEKRIKITGKKRPNRRGEGNLRCNRARNNITYVEVLQYCKKKDLQEETKTL